MLPTLVVKETAKDAWDAIKLMRVSIDHIQHPQIQGPVAAQEIALSIETLLDFDALLLEELIGCLRHMEEHRSGSKAPLEGSKLLQKEQWASLMDISVPPRAGFAPIAWKGMD
ncbi:hypothetical protein E2562_031747 [Oryza meyeriana var. granulata]|uniref:Uncharacterized protein n=1 Tax=Oryza meyeriana var. granulata TaxID=110450 RepID=A0A6G1CUD6_9ORYZ|nr:hypothetical protein E2562_031747 [Oryza meyeriana var. granulata]